MGVQKKNNLGYSPNEQENKKKIVTQMQMCMLFSINCI